MGALLDRLRAGAPAYSLEPAGEGYVLVRQQGRDSEFDHLIRDLMNRQTDEFVILPIRDGSVGYDRAIILPF